MRASKAMRRIAAAACALCAATLGCAAPSRHLTSRQVDDPLVLPRGLAAFSVAPAVVRFPTLDRTRADLAIAFRYGITDRLELKGGSLAFAFLDDAPLPEGAADGGRKRGPLSLGLRAGVVGFGYSSLNGAIVLPVVAAEARKHVGGRAYLWGELGWTAVWMSSPWMPVVPYSEYLWPTGRSSQIFAAAGVVVQVVDRLTLSGGLRGDYFNTCVAPTCDWVGREAEVFFGPSLRPRYWLDLGLFAAAGFRERAARRTVTDPTELTPPPPPGRVSWLSLSGVATVRW